MKKSYILFASLLVGGIFAFASCTKTGPDGPPGQNGAAGPVLYGTIIGNVIMNNQYGVAVTNDYTGGYIKLTDPVTNATIDSIVTSSTGQYIISNVATGTYNMECIYSGYGINVHQNLEFTGGTLQVDNKIAAIPAFTVTTVSDSIRHKTNVAYLYGTITADPNGARTLLVFVGNSSSTSANPGTYNFTTTKVIPADSTTFSIPIPVNNFYANSFVYRSTAYFAIYGAADNYTYGDYTNFTYGQTVYTAISAFSYSPLPTLILP